MQFICFLILRFLFPYCNCNKSCKYFNRHLDSICNSDCSRLAAELPRRPSWGVRLWGTSGPRQTWGWSRRWCCRRGRSSQSSSAREDRERILFCKKIKSFSLKTFLMFNEELKRPHPDVTSNVKYVTNYSSSLVQHNNNLKDEYISYLL